MQAFKLAIDNGADFLGITVVGRLTTMRCLSTPPPPPRPAPGGEDMMLSHPKLPQACPCWCLPSSAAPHGCWTRR